MIVHGGKAQSQGWAMKVTTKVSGRVVSWIEEETFGRTKAECVARYRQIRKSHLSVYRRLTEVCPCSHYPAIRSAGRSVSFVPVRVRLVEIKQ